MVIAFVGCGFSCTSILYHLEKMFQWENFNTDITIKIFECRDSFGDGISYNILNDHVLLNRPSKFMSLDHNDLEHFNNLSFENTQDGVVYETRKNLGNI